MKKILKLMLITTGGIVAVFVLALGGFFLKQKSVMSVWIRMETKC